MNRVSLPACDPLLILAPPRSFTSLIGAMLGQHPQMHGLPETHLFGDETMAGWWSRCEGATYPMKDGLVRAVAQLCLGEQSEATVRAANGWLRRRSHLTTGLILEILASWAHPHILVDKSPSIVYHLHALQRAQSFFSRARFIHLLRHPRGHGESVMRYIEHCVRYGPVPVWLSNLARFPAPFAPGAPEAMDPQWGWYVLNRNICQFLASVPEERWLRVRGEDVLANPESMLRRIAGWLGLRTDAEAISQMMHPERSPYACYGPPGACLGNDILFLENPGFLPSEAKTQELDGSLEWRRDGGCFWPEVKELAWQFGY